MNTLAEEERLRALRGTGLLDTAPEARFDRITRVAAALAGTPVALISLIDADRQWFKSCVGLDVAETARDVAFCDHAIRTPEVTVAPDATLDPRFAANPLVTGDPHIRFYAGAPLVVGGHAIGTLCVIDTAPRTTFDEAQQRALADLAALVVAEIEHTEKLSAREIAVQELQHRLGNTFAQVVGLISLTATSEQSKEDYVAELRKRILSLNEVHRRLAEGRWEAADIAPVLEAAILPAIGGRADRITLSGPKVWINARTAMSLSLAMFELATNSVKHGAIKSGAAPPQVRWRVDGEQFEIVWEEAADGVTARSEIAEKGFGSRLLQRIVPTELGGTAEHSFADSKVRYALKTRLKAIT